MSIVQSNPWEDEDRAMQQELERVLGEDYGALSAEEVAEMERQADEDEAAWRELQQEMAEEAYAAEVRIDVFAAIDPYLPEDVSVTVREDGGAWYVTTTHTDAVTAEHATSLSAAICQDLEAEFHQVYYRYNEDFGTIQTIWSVQWRLA